MLPTLRNMFESPLDVFSREFDRALVSRGVEAGTYPVDVREDADAIVVDAELPGFSRDEIEITTEDGILTISAGREATSKVEGKFHVNERSWRKVTRSFRFPNSVDLDKVAASLESGILTLTLPKREEVKPRRIEVK